MFTRSPCLDPQHDKRKPNLKRMTSEITHLWACDKTLESEFQHKGNKQMKRVNAKQNLAVFSAATDSEQKIFKYYTEKDTTKFGVNFHCTFLRIYKPVRILVPVRILALATAFFMFKTYDSTDFHTRGVLPTRKLCTGRHFKNFFVFISHTSRSV